MNPIVIVIAVVVVAGRRACSSPRPRRRDTGDGHRRCCPRETRKRDRGRRRTVLEAPAPRRPAARSSARPRVERRGAGELVDRRARPTWRAWVPPDPEALGVTRRQFFNRASSC